MHGRSSPIVSIRTTVLCIMIVLSSRAAILQAAAKPPIVIGRETQLFVDDALIEHREGVVRKVHACQKLDQSVLRAERPWERTDIDRRLYVYGTALPQENGLGYRLWYGASGERLLYATSNDGIHWDIFKNS